MNASTLKSHNDQWCGARFGTMGFVAAFLGTFAAATLVPSNVSTRGALFVPAAVMAISFLFVPAVSSIGNLRNVFRAENIAASSLVYWVLLDLLQGSYPLENVSAETARFSLILTGTFVSFLWVGVMLPALRAPQSLTSIAKARVPSSAVFRTIVVFFILCMLRFAISCKFDFVLMFSSLSKGRFSTPWAASHTGGLSAVLDHLSYFGYLLPALTVVLHNRLPGFRRQVILSILMSLIAMAFIASGGGRRICGVMILAALGTWVLSRRTIRIQHAILSVSLILGLLVLMQFLLLVRSFGLENTDGQPAFQRALSAFTGEKNENTSKYDHIHVDDNFLRICQIVKIVPESHPHVYHKYIWWVLVRPIPRIIWPGKPEDGGFNLTEEVDAQASLSSSIVGELYLSYGFVAVALGGFLFGRLSTLPSVFYKFPHDSLGPLMAGYLSMVLLVGARSMIELILFSYSIIFLVVGSRWIKFSPVRKQKIIGKQVHRQCA